MTKVTALYDSHVHWLMTGEKQSYLDVQKYSLLAEISPLTLQKKNYRGDWLFGFGWTDGQLSLSVPYQELDRISSAYPICFIKKDGHSCLLNSVALARVLKLIESNSSFHPFIERDSKGHPNGILKENAFYAIYPQIPALSAEENHRCLLEAQKYFLEQGFTHIRDMTCSQAQWQCLKQMSVAGELRLFADINFNAETLAHAQKELIPFVLEQLKETHDHLRIRGIKIFFDGSLGSRSALLTENYRGTNHSGHALWSEKDLLSLMRQCWENNLEVSVHTLGDLAVDKVVDVARMLYSQKVRGYLNLEHVQVLLPETILKMKSLYVRCHMQPSHWLSDKSFVKQRLSDGTLKHLFAWEALRRAKVPVSFGSDAPIEEANVLLTRQALDDSENAGIEKFRGDFFEHYSHPDPAGKGRLAVTYFENYTPIKVELG